MGGIVSTLAFPFPDKAWSQSDLLRRERLNQLVYLTTESGHRIPAVHIRSDERKFTIIYSHGNAEDVGLSLPYLDHLSQCCNCNVLAYEYCGYSIAEGEPSEKNCYECINAAYRYLTEGRKSFDQKQNPARRAEKRSSTTESIVADPSRVVLFGRSLGTGPTVDLAARLLSKNNGVDRSLAGVILQSPLESAGRCVLSEMACYALYPFDLFKSFEKIEKLAPTPVFVMHGTNDKVVPCSSGKALYAALMKERARRGLLKSDSSGEQNNGDNNRLVYAPKWIPGVGHNDMPEFDCLNDVAKFLYFLEMQLSS